MTQQLSKHRHISFTAHYTGYIWYQMGISHEALATTKGKSLAYLVHPIESWAEKYVGGSMRTTLKQRHTMLDHHLEQLIQENPDLQVLEIACGLSPRGWWFRQHYPSITYRELDLPDMAQTKQSALQQIEKNAPEVLSVDLFTEAFAQAFEVFDPNRPLVVISEGLINYFDKDLLKLASIIWNSSKLLKLMSRSSFSFHFKTPQEVKVFFKDTEFQQVNVEQPQIFFGQISSDAHEQHLGDLVWTIHAQIK